MQSMLYPYALFFRYYHNTCLHTLMQIRGLYRLMLPVAAKNTLPPGYYFITFSRKRCTARPHVFRKIKVL